MNLQTGLKSIRYLDYTELGLKRKTTGQNLKATVGDRIQIRLNNGADLYGEITKLTESYITLGGIDHSDIPITLNIKDVAEYYVTIQGQIGLFINGKGIL